METLSYGLKKPTNGDLSSEWFVEMANNLVKINDHIHNGTNSAKIESKDLTPFKQVLSDLTKWVEVKDSSNHTVRWEQTVTVPDGGSISTYTPHFKELDANLVPGETLFLSFVVITPTPITAPPTTYKIYSNDPTLKIQVQYDA